MINSKNKAERDVWQAVPGPAVNPGSDGPEMSGLFYGGGSVAASRAARRAPPALAQPPPAPVQWILLK